MASDPQTWAELKTRLANWADRDDSDIDTLTAEAIALAERRFNRTIFAPERDIVADLSIDSEEEDLPADLWALKALHLTTDPKTVLEQMTLAELRSRHGSNTTGKPENYAIRGEKIIFGPAPDASYTGKISYTQTIPALGASQATNWLLTDHPDAYIEGALAELHTLFRDVEGARLFEAKVIQTIEEINESSRRRTTGSAPIRIRPPVVV